MRRAYLKMNQDWVDNELETIASTDDGKYAVMTRKEKRWHRADALHSHVPAGRMYYDRTIHLVFMYEGEWLEMACLYETGLLETPMSYDIDKWVKTVVKRTKRSITAAMKNIADDQKQIDMMVDMIG